MELKFFTGETEVQVQIDDLRGPWADFLETYGETSYLGEEFAALLGESKRYERLMEQVSWGEQEFWKSVTEQLESMNHLNASPVYAGGVEIPKRALLPILEVLLPGSHLISLETVEQYEAAAHVKVPDADRGDLQQVLDTYPVRLSMHVIRQSRISRDVGYQFMPFVEELDPTGLKNTWVGQFHRGVLEQMYQNRPIFVLHMSCPVYCRFCFRKHKDCRNQDAPTVEDVKQALKHIEQSPRIKEIVLTGGEPLLNRATLTCAVEGLSEIDHVQTIRIASRCISYYPHLFYANDSFWLKYLTQKNRELQRRNKRIEIATHFIHPDEISIHSLEIISRLVNAGIGVYTQTPFLKGCNDSGAELTQLYRELRAAGSEIHYVYIPCSPIQGNKVYWTPLSEGHRAAAYLRANLSDRAMPILCTATPVGKIDWNTSGWAIEPDPDDPSYLWMRTPYTDAYFKEFVPSFVLKDARELSDGTISTRFMAEAGDPGLFLGHFSMEEGRSWEVNMTDLLEVQKMIIADQRVLQSPADTSIPALQRIHKTRVEIDVCDAGSVHEVVSYIAARREITDAVLAAKNDVTSCWKQTMEYLQKLSKIKHLSCIRLRSLNLNYHCSSWDAQKIDDIRRYNRLRAVNPQRIELETQFVHSSEFSARHNELVRTLSASGITVYANILLLTDINDHEEEMKQICYYCRQIGIELFTLYAAGMPVQLRWNRERPVDASTVITIATHLRRHQSGREVPLYVVRTALGDADFNLNCTIEHSESSRVFFTLHPYRKHYFTEMQKGFQWPVTAVEDQEGRPIIPVEGMTVRTNRAFFLYT